MAKKLTFWATQNTGPVTDDDRLIDGGDVLDDLPAPGFYDTTNGLGGPTVEFSTAPGQVIFNPSGDWNSVKLFQIAGKEKLLGGDQLVMKNFVDARADFGSGRKDLDILVDGSKRGQIDTGSGEDNIEVLVSSNGANPDVFENTFDINTGSDEDNVLFGSAGPVPGFPGNDTTGQWSFINADLGSGNDSFDSSALVAANDVDGGSGKDTISSGDGDDIIDGGSGNDVLNAGGGDNLIFGDTGDDEITSGNGKDTIDGSSGDDIINSGGGKDEIDAGSGKDLVNGGGGADDIIGGSGADTINGGGGADDIFGGSGSDALNGQGGADDIFGGSGGDIIRGGGGNDFIQGDGDSDTLTGNNGNDTFNFADLGDSGVGAGGRDIITDFAQGSDLIDLSAFGPLAFIAGGAFSGAAEVRFFQTATETIVEVDANGDTATDLQVELTGLIGLVGGDFTLV